MTISEMLKQKDVKELLKIKDEQRKKEKEEKQEKPYEAYQRIAKEMLNASFLKYNHDFYLYDNSYSYYREINLSDNICEYLNSKEQFMWRTTKHVQEIKLALNSYIEKTERMNVFTADSKKNLIPFRNGLLDLDYPEKIIPHTSNFYSNYCLPYDYHKKSDYPLITNFLNEIYEKNEYKINLLMEFIGYCIDNKSELQKFLILHGQSRCGKGVITRIIQKIVGEEQCVGFNISDLGKQFGMASLVNKKVAISGECNRSYFQSNELELLKSWTGGDVIGINRKYKDPISSVIVAKPILLMNEVPTIFDATSALANRSMYIQHEISFEEVQDPQLFNNLNLEIGCFAYDCIHRYIKIRSIGYFTYTKPSYENDTDIPALIRNCLTLDPSLNPHTGKFIYHEPNLDVMITNRELTSLFHAWNSVNQVDTNIKDDSFLRKFSTILPKIDKTYRTSLDRYNKGVKLSTRGEEILHGFREYRDRREFQYDADIPHYNDLPHGGKKY